MSDKFLIVVVGPTAVGKTEISLQIAQYFNSQIINADSRQVYQDLNIGTAKPTPDELKRVPHHLVDFLPVSIEYNAGKFEKDALTCLKKIFEQDNCCVLAGGSGLYVKALCEGLDALPKNKEIRTKLTETYQEKGLVPLLDELQKKDPEYFDQVDRQNPQRIIRALEVIRASQKTYTELRKGEKKERNFQVIKIGLTRDREELYERINLRMDKMLEEGLLEEVKSLENYKQLNALQTVGYQEVFDYLDGKYDWEEMVRLLKRNSRRYAKRQLTWFRKDTETTWFDAGDLKPILDHIQKRMAD
ncbi:tRNA (adenosine(37)-N6)-dimethylallyltransferase MiaA [Rapidithrix thailandica]|uniref:tRNA dimethylallyltransferase n=1 Tax=Rapidithrix thailandica TaxID=413964 RepID=A0AAW9S7L6_9BACT